MCWGTVAYITARTAVPKRNMCKTMCWDKVTCITIRTVPRRNKYVISLCWDTVTYIIARTVPKRQTYVIWLYVEARLYTLLLVLYQRQKYVMWLYVLRHGIAHYSSYCTKERTNVCYMTVFWGTVLHITAPIVPKREQKYVIWLCFEARYRTLQLLLYQRENKSMLYDCVLRHGIVHYYSHCTKERKRCSSCCARWMRSWLCDGH